MTTRTSRHVAILAGGKGTRFWPVGRASRPKQILALDGDDPRTLLRATYDRVAPLCGAAGPWVVASKALAPAVRRLLPAAARARLVFEPQGKNTAAAVALAAHAVASTDSDAVVAVVPSDHHVAPDGAFRAALSAMLERAASSGRIQTLGLQPTFPATGYGYLEIGAKVAQSAPGAIHAVARYVEKPARPAANRFVRGGRHLWNLGTFAFKPSVFLEAFVKSFPEGAKAFEKVLATPSFSKHLKAAYAAIPSISVDFAVMEKTPGLEVLSTQFEWDDLGSWDAVARHATPDEVGNVLSKEHVAIDATDCFVRAEDGTSVALLGVSDLIVVRTKDALLVARRGRGEDVRRVYEAWAAKGREDLLR